MADNAIDKPSVGPRKRTSSPSIVLPPLVFLGAMFIAADFTAIEFRPLKVLQITYPRWLDYSHILIPAACAVIWLALLRKWPNGGAIFAALLCFTLIPLVPQYAQSRVAKVPVRRWIDSNDLKSIEATVGVPITERGSREGTFVIVGPSNEERVRAELGRLKLLDGPAAE